MQPAIIKEDGFEYIETGGNGECLLLLHGLFGALSNFEQLINHFKDTHNVVVPLLPIYSLPREEAGLAGLLSFVREFVKYKSFDGIHVLGNSLGGHLAQLFVLERPDLIASMTLTGSSGLFESGMGDGYPRRGDYEYIRAKTAETFDPAGGAITGDNLFGGDISRWQKFTNSLRLKLANRQASKKPGESAAIFSEIMGNPSTYPIFTSNEDFALLYHEGRLNDNNNNAWHE